MGDKDGFFAGIGKVYFSDKPISSLSGDELQLNDSMWHEIGNFSADGLSVDSEDSSETENHFADGVPFTMTMNFEIDEKRWKELYRKHFRLPKLPRKLKKYVKKHYFDQYPKRISAQILRYVFAVNNQNKARKVGIYIGVDVAKDESVHNVVMWPNSKDYINQLERAYQQTKSDE